MARATDRATAKAFSALAAAGVAFLMVGADPAEALPSYARQTGQPCATCHTAFPELTPYGRRFKIGGYTAGGGDWQGPPISAMYMPGFTRTASNQDAPPAPGLHVNNNLASQQVSGFIAGQLYGNLGSFIQITGDPVGGTVGLDASDVRYADTLKLFGKNTIWGIDANNAPTVEDPGTRRPRGAGRRFHRPSRPHSGRRSRIWKGPTPELSAARAHTFSGTTCSTPT